MTIYTNLLSRGYFPKELPPSFFTDQFAVYAASKAGRQTLAAYKPVDNCTECASFDLSLPGLSRRPLRIPHPASYSQLARITSKNFRRLLKKANRSPFSKSRPVYAVGRYRAIHANVKPANLARERAACRAGGSYLVRLDISHFYPALYTHAIGWAIDPKLRKRKNWGNKKLLGKQLDQAMMDLQGKVSQGIPIGTDASFLLAEAVLAQVDRKIGMPVERCYRWFDDYEITCDTREQAEQVLATLVEGLRGFNLRPNSRKTQIVELPRPSQDAWQTAISEKMRVSFRHPNDMVALFDAAFQLRGDYPDFPVMVYALGALFKLRTVSGDVARIAQSGITQAVLAEPGAAQKAFALLSFWQLNGLALDRNLLAGTINRMIHRHRGMGVSSDVSWALSFCLNHGIALDSRAGKVLADCEDDCVAIQALDAHRQGLLPKGFSKARLAACLGGASMDGEHWLLAYESVRHNFLTTCATAVAGNSLFSELLKRQVTFYGSQLPPYASVVHPGGAPEWVVNRWLDVFAGKKERLGGEVNLEEQAPLFAILSADVQRLGHIGDTRDELLLSLLSAQRPLPDAPHDEAYEPYEF